MSTREPDRTETGGIEFRCPVCGHDGRFRPSESRVTCAGCDATYAARVADGFALLENDGWAVTVSLEVPGDPVDARADGS